MKDLKESNVSNPKDTSRSGSSKVVSFLVFLIVALILVAGGLGFLYWKQSRDAQQMQIELTAEKDSISHNLEQVLVEYNSLETTNAALQTRLDEERSRAESLLAEIKQVKEVSYSKIREYQRELGTLRAIMRKMVGEIDSLNTVNRTLVEENTRMRTEYTESQKSLQNLTSVNEELSATLARGAEIQARNVEIMAIDKRGKVVKYARRAAKLRTCMTLMENSIAKAGPSQVYIRLTAPDGALLVDPAGGKFTFQGVEMPFSASREVDYQNADIDVCVFFGEGESFSKGVYKVEVFMAGAHIGQGEFLLR